MSDRGAHSRAWLITEHGLVDTGFRACVTPPDHKEFIMWLRDNCATAEYTWNYNRGEPFFAVKLPDDYLPLLLLTWERPL